MRNQTVEVNNLGDVILFLLMLCSQVGEKLCKLNSCYLMKGHN